MLLIEYQNICEFSLLGPNDDIFDPIVFSLIIVQIWDCLFHFFQKVKNFLY